MGLSLPSVVVRTALGFTVSLSWVWPNAYGGGRVTFLTPAWSFDSLLISEEPRRVEGSK